MRETPMEKPLLDLIDKVLHDVILWAKESILRSLLVIILFLVLLVPLIEYLQDVIRSIPYPQLFINARNFITGNISPQTGFLLFLLFYILINQYFLKREIQKTRTIVENFEKGLNGWNIPLGAGWAIQNGIECLGKMLSVTNTYFFGTLKETYSWYDYQIAFQARFDGSIPENSHRLGIVIRAENNLNGIMLQITPNEFIPHFLYDGTFIVDSANSEKLSTILPTNQWITFKISVSGNQVDLKINEYSLIYKIPIHSYSVASGFFTGYNTFDLKDLEKNNAENEEKWKDIWDRLDKADKIPNEEKKQEQRNQIIAEISSLPPRTKVSLEYHRGAVGFRSSGNEKTYIRNLKVTKI